MSLKIRAAAVLLSFIPSAIACSCAAPPPPCQAYWQTPAVFLGTVTEILSTRDGRAARARMRIDHAYKGISSDSVTLFDDGMCDGPDLKLGEQYLMYTPAFDDPKDDVPSRGCRRSRSVRYAAEDLEFLDGLAAAPPTGTIKGQAVGRENDWSNDQALPGATIEIRGNGATLTTVTGTDGRYSVGNLDPTVYTVSATHLGFNLVEFSGSDTLRRTEVHAGGCVDIHLILAKQWRGSLEGRLFRDDGVPGPENVPVMLIRTYLDQEGVRRSFPGESADTDAQGRFAFRNVSPGRYKIVLNTYSLPTSRVPYPLIYWPNARNEASAQEIEIKDEDSTRRYDFILPRELRTASNRSTGHGHRGAR